MDSLVIAMADYHAVPAGNALAVDRDAFAAGITAAIENHPRIQRYSVEITEVPDTENGPVIIATGPLTAGARRRDRQARQKSLSFMMPSLLL